MAWVGGMGTTATVGDLNFCWVEGRSYISTGRDSIVRTIPPGGERRMGEQQLLQLASTTPDKNLARGCWEAIGGTTPRPCTHNQLGQIYYLRSNQSKNNCYTGPISQEVYDSLEDGYAKDTNLWEEYHRKEYKYWKTEEEALTALGKALLLGEEEND